MTLTIESELSRMSNVIPFPRVRVNDDPAIIRAQIEAGCRALKLSDDQRQECEAEGLATYWRSYPPRSNAWCVAAGMKLARKLAHDNSPPDAA